MTVLGVCVRVTVPFPRKKMSKAGTLTNVSLPGGNGVHLTFTSGMG